MAPAKHFSLKTANWLYSINVCLGFLPNKPNLTTDNINKLKPTKLSRIHSYIMIVITSILFFYCLSEGRETDGYENLIPHYATHVVLTHLSFICMYISILVTFIYVNVTKSGAVLSLVSEVRAIDAKLGRCFIPGWKFTLEVLISIFLVLFYVIYEEIERNMFHIYAAVRKLFIVASVVLALQIHSFGIQFRLRFKQINVILKKMLINGKVVNFHAHDVGDVYDVFLNLVNCVMKFNRIFGWQILFLCGTFVLCVLHVINSAIVFLNCSELDEISGHFWGVFLLYLFATLVICIPFANSCNDAAEEAKMSSLLAYTLLSKKQKKPNGGTQDYLKNLELLAGVPWPGFSAAGFFDVDHTMLFTLFGSVTSYLIVLIQLKDMKM